MHHQHLQLQSHSHSRLWISFGYKMFQFRTLRSILLNTSLFGLGILTTLVIISTRQDSIDLCDFPTATFSYQQQQQLQQLQQQQQQKQHYEHEQQQYFHQYTSEQQQQQQQHVSNDVFIADPSIPGLTKTHPSKANGLSNTFNNIVHTGINNDGLPSPKTIQWATQRSNLSRSNNNSPVIAAAAAPAIENDPEATFNSGQIDRSVSVNKLQLPFTSKMTRNLIYVVTPTYNRPEQIPELTRLAQALMHVNHLVHWVVVEDVDRQKPGLERFLNKFNLNYSLLKSVKPKVFNKVVGKPRGVGGRRAALEWLRFHQFPGIVYFADDDNTYDSDIFRQMLRTKRVSMWPVGLVTDLGVSSPIVRQGKVVGFYDGWKAYRKFPVDMAGFAINLKLIHSKKNANMPWVAGYEEDEILRSLGITLGDIQPLANNCTEGQNILWTILVWHTKAVKNNWSKKATNLKPGLEETSNLNILLKKLPKPNANTSNNGNGNSNSNNNNYPSSKDAERTQQSNGGFSFLRFFFGNNFI